MPRRIWMDIKAALERDPAARGFWEVFFCYPGLHAVWWHRLAHRFWTRGWTFPARWLSQFVRFFTGIEIHPGAKIGPGFFIDHGLGVVIGETTEIGAGVTLYQGVTLGGTTLTKGKRHPTLEDGVVVGAGAKILGAVTIGERCRVGANAVVVKSVPADSVVVGVPGEIIKRGPHAPATGPDLEHGRMPDVLGDTLAALVARVEQLEKRDPHAPPGARGRPIPAPDHGVWHGEDFAI
jgi:serine O-acetyltransferase